MHLRARPARLLQLQLLDLVGAFLFWLGKYSHVYTPRAQRMPRWEWCPALLWRNNGATMIVGSPSCVARLE